VSLNMSRAEREEFLAGLHVGIISVAVPDRGPLTVPVWYTYQPGGLVSVGMEERSRKAQAIRVAGRFSLCAQQEEPPCKYVSVEGPAVIEPIDMAERIEIAHRYLGREEGDAYLAANEELDDIVIRMTPERWYTADFAKLEEGG
jgi:nitroimidazol reductase NimA-like FMN-containing flavoprotein (pyridoxamine 5'-phosphate oxidase superfamily)